MGYERKRGKLQNWNKFCGANRIRILFLPATWHTQSVKYIITLNDTLCKDSARKVCGSNGTSAEQAHYDENKQRVVQIGFCSHGCSEHVRRQRGHCFTHVFQ